jgi:hypothetical protein
MRCSVIYLLFAQQIMIPSEEQGRTPASKALFLRIMFFAWLCLSFVQSTYSTVIKGAMSFFPQTENSTGAKLLGIILLVHLSPGPPFFPACCHRSVTANLDNDWVSTLAAI